MTHSADPPQPRPLPPPPHPLDPPEAPRTGTSRGLRDALAGLLLDAEGAASAEELADVLWVAGLAGLGAQGDAPGREEPPGPDGAAAPVPPSAPPAARDGAKTAAPEPPEDRPEPAGPTAGPRVGLHPYAAADGSGASGGPPDGAAGHAVRVAQPPALAGTLDLARALRPLRQSVGAPGAPLLDEEATAQASGEAGRGRLVPVWRPAARRRFSVDLVVDCGATMAVWHRLAGELCTVLERHGAFADVRCWALDTDGPSPRLTPFRRGRGTPGRAERWPGPLEDPSGHRVLLVLTDGVGPAWYGADLPDFLARTAAQRPAAALQVLPRRLWHRTALRTVPVELRVPDPARPAPVVRTDAALPGRPAPRAVRWLPVMEVDGAWLAPWAELVAGRAPGWSPMLAAPVRGVPRPRRAVAPAPPADPAEHVARFRSGASPDAFRLACHLAAAPLSLPVMRLVQQATVPSSGQTDLAEIFVSGILTRRGPAGPEPDEVVYDFAPGVRDELLAELTRSESLRVLDDVLAKVSGRVAATFGGTLDFRALAAGADSGGPAAADGAGSPGRVLPPASLPFAEVAVAVLSGAGGQHRALARRLAAAVEGRAAGPPPQRRGPLPDVPREPAGQAVPGVPFPEHLVPVPPLHSPPDLERLIGRARELEKLGAVARPGDPAPTVVVIEGRLGMGARRLVQEYARRHGHRHRITHWIDASREDSLRAGLSALGRALGVPADGADGIWRALARQENWLLVLDDLGPEHDLSAADSVLPPLGHGVVLITTRRAYDGRHRADAMITLDPLTPAEVADHVRATVGPEESAHGGRLSPSVLTRIVGRLPTLPAELAKVDVRAEFARELALAEQPGPRPVYEWRAEGEVRGLAGYDRDRLAVAVAEGPLRLYRVAAGRVESTWLSDVEKPVRAVAAFTGQDGTVTLAVAHGRRVIWLRNPSSSARQRPVGVVDFTRIIEVADPPDPVTGTPGGVVTALTMFTDAQGRTALVTGGSARPQVWDVTATGMPTAQLPFRTFGPVQAMAVFETPDGSRRMAVVASGTARIWDLDTGAPVTSPSPDPLSGATALVTLRLPNRPDVLAAIDGGPVVRLWDTATGAPAGALDTRSPQGLVALTVLGSSRHGASRLATARPDGLVQVWDIGAVVDPQDPYAAAAGGSTEQEDPVAALPDGTLPPGQPAGPDDPATSDPRFLPWLANELGGDAGVTADVLTLLMPGSAVQIQELIFTGVLERTAQDRIRLTRHRHPGPYGYSTAPRTTLLHLLTAACPEPTSAAATWVPYTTLRTVMPSLMARVLDTERLYATEPAVDPVVVLAVATRWAWYHLLRGSFAEAGRLVADAEAWADRWAAPPAGENPAGLTAGLLADEWRGQLCRIALRAALALGQADQVRVRYVQITGSETAGPREVAEAHLTVAESDLWRGDLAGAEAGLARARARMAHDRLSRDDAMAQRGRLLLTRHALAAGRLRDAVGSLTAARLTVAALRAEAADEAAAVASLEARGPGGGHGDDPEAAQRRLEQDPAFETARTAAAAVDVLEGKLTLIADDLVPRGQAGELSLGPDLARRKVHVPPEEDPTTFALFAESVPDYHLHQYLTLCEQFALALVRTATGPAWSAQGGAGAPRSTALSHAALVLEAVEPYRTRQRSSRVLAHAGFLAARGETALATGEYGPALGFLAQARSAIEDGYGPSCPLLPRLRLLQGWGHHLNGLTTLARRYVAEAESLIDALHGDAPHQDRVTLLRAGAALAPGPLDAELADRAERMAATLVEGVARPPRRPQRPS